MSEKRIKIEVYPDYLDTIITLLSKRKAGMKRKQTRQKKMKP